MKKNTHFLWVWGPVILWCVFIFVMSYRPVPEGFGEADTFNGIDIIYHFIAYLPLGILVYRARPALLFSFLFVTLYGFFNECHQHFLPYRNFEWHDVIVNSLSGIGGAWLPWKLKK